jgi:hypothetical protein
LFTAFSYINALKVQKIISTFERRGACGGAVA